MRIAPSINPQTDQLYGEFNPAVALAVALAPCVLAITVIGATLFLKDINERYKSLSEHNATAGVAPRLTSMAVVITTLALGVLSQMEHGCTIFTKLGVTAVGISVLLALAHICGARKTHPSIYLNQTDQIDLVRYK
jgi:hypothetical protein